MMENVATSTKINEMKGKCILETTQSWCFRKMKKIDRLLANQKRQRKHK